MWVLCYEGLSMPVKANRKAELARIGGQNERVKYAHSSLPSADQVSEGERLPRREAAVPRV